MAIFLRTPIPPMGTFLPPLYFCISVFFSVFLYFLPLGKSIYIVGIIITHPYTFPW